MPRAIFVPSSERPNVAEPASVASIGKPRASVPTSRLITFSSGIGISVMVTPVISLSILNTVGSA